MADILTDYREWRDAQPERVSTHGEGCMIHRLARELERTRAALVAVAEQDGTLSVSEGMLFVDVDGVEELAFDYATPPTQSTPGEGTKQDGCTLTDEERDAVECGIQAIGLAPRDERTLAYADRLRGLLERLK